MSNKIVALLAILTPELQKMEEDQAYFVQRHEELNEEVLSLRERLESAEDENSAHRYENDRLRKELDTLRNDLATMKGYGSHTDAVQQTLKSFMATEGKELWAKEATPANNYVSGKIECIKRVRQITGWGLKESKDFCEAEFKEKTYPS